MRIVHANNTQDIVATASSTPERRSIDSYEVRQSDFDQWEQRFNSKQDVIDHLLDELDRAMRFQQMTTGRDPERQAM